MFAGLIPQRGKIELVDAPEPRLGEGLSADPHGGNIIFQPELGCLCGSDLPYFDDDEEHGGHPQPVGQSLHEMIGRVVESDSPRFQVGDQVLAVPVRQNGFFQRYCVSDRRVIPLDARPAREMALMAQPLGTVLFAVRKLPSLVDQTVAVVGQGPIGQMFNAVLRLLGARQIIGLDKIDDRLAASAHFGAHHTVNVDRDDPVGAVKELTQGRLADWVVEAVGHRDAALNLCIGLCRKNGNILSFGVPPEFLDRVRWRDLFLKNLTIHTSVDPDFTRDFPLAMQWISEGRIDLSRLTTHRYPVRDIQQAFELFRDRRDGVLKVLLDFPSA